MSRVSAGMVTASAGSGLLIPSESKNDRMKFAENSPRTTAELCVIIQTTHAPSFLSASFEIPTMLIKGAFLSYDKCEVAVSETVVVDNRLGSEVEGPRACHR